MDRYVSVLLGVVPLLTVVCCVAVACTRPPQRVSTAAVEADVDEIKGAYF